MSSLSSSSRHGPHARYSMVDKTSGDKVGEVIMNEGQEVPDLGQVELRIVEAEAEDLEDVLHAGIEDTLVGNSLDINGNKAVPNITSKNHVSRLVSSFVDTIDKKFQLSSVRKNILKGKIEKLVLEHCDEVPLRFKTPAQFGWIRKVTVRSSDNYVNSVVYQVNDLVSKGRRFLSRKDVQNYLVETGNQALNVDNFCFEYEYEDRFNKPFQFGWLRNVTIRSSDNCVTSVGYLTSPDSEGYRRRLNYKKDIEQYLRGTENNDLDVKDFVTVRKVLGLSSEFEPINYSGPMVVTNELPVTNSGKGVANSEGVQHDNIAISDHVKEHERSSLVDSDYKTVNTNNSKNSQDSSDYTIVGDSSSSTDTSSEDSTDDNSSSSDSDDSSDSSHAIVIATPSKHPHLPITNGIMASPDLTKNTSSSVGRSYVDPIIMTGGSVAIAASGMKDIDCKTAIQSLSQPAFVKDQFASPLNWSPVAASFNPPVASSPAVSSSMPAVNPQLLPPPSHHKPQTALIQKAKLLMVSTESGGGRRQQKMSIKYGVKVGKGMKIFGEKFGLDFGKLRFFVDGKQLTGEEMAEGLDGAKILVEGMG